MFDHGNYIAHQQTRIVVLHALGLVAQVVAALVDGDALILVCKAFHLAPPGVPEIGEAVDHHDKRPAADGGVMNLDPIGIGKALFHARLEIRSLKTNSSKAQAHQDQLGTDRHLFPSPYSFSEYS